MVDLNKLYWEERKSISDIVKELGSSTFTVYKQMIKERIPRRERNEARREKILIKPNLSLSPTLSYVIACLLGDGSISVYRDRPSVASISLAANDEEFVNAFSESLRLIGLHPSKCQKLSNSGNIQFVTRAFSLMFYNWYKTLTTKDIEKMAFAYPKEFLRGIYDSEGSFSCGWFQRKERIKPELRCIIFISNTDKWLVNLVCKLGLYLGFKFGIHKTYRKEENHKDSYNLFLSKRSKILDFLTEIEPTIPRKSINKYYSVINEGKNEKQISLSAE